MTNTHTFPAQRTIELLCGWSAVLLVFAAPVSRSLFAIAGALFAIAWVAEGKLKAKMHLLSTVQITAPILLLSAIVLVWSAFSPASPDSVIKVLKVHAKLPLVLMLVTTLSDERWRQRAWIAFVMTMGLTVFSTYANVVISLPWSRTQNQGIGQDHSVFIEYVSQSVMTAVAIALAAQRALSATSSRIALVWWTAAAIALGSVVFLLQGRSGLVAIAVVAGIFVWLYTPRDKSIKVIMVVTVLAGLLLASSPLLQDRIRLGYNEVVNYQPFGHTSLGARIDMWRFSLNEFLEHPFAGTGAGTYPALAGQHFGHCIWACEHPHNQYLYFAMEYGLAGLAAFLWLLWCIWETAYRSQRPERSVLFALLAVVMVDSLYNAPLWWRGVSYFIYSVLGLLIASNLPRLVVGATPAESPSGQSL